MSKQKMSCSFDDDVYEYLQQDHVNASGLLNDLAKAHIEGGDARLIRQFRIEQVEDELEDAESRADRKRKQLERLRETQQEDADRFESTIEELEDALWQGQRIPPSRIDNTFEADRVIDELKERNPQIPDRAYQSAAKHEPVDWRKGVDDQ